MAAAPGTEVLNPAEEEEEEAEEANRCPICQDTLSAAPDNACRTECGHRFHTRCLLHWIRSRARGHKLACPLCNQVLLEDLARESDDAETDLVLLRAGMALQTHAQREHERIEQWIFVGLFLLFVMFLVVILTYDDMTAVVTNILRKDMYLVPLVKEHPAIFGNVLARWIEDTRQTHLQTCPPLPDLVEKTFPTATHVVYAGLQEYAVLFPLAITTLWLLPLVLAGDAMVVVLFGSFSYVLDGMAWLLQELPALWQENATLTFTEVMQVYFLGPFLGALAAWLVHIVIRSTRALL